MDNPEDLPPSGYGIEACVASTFDAGEWDALLTNSSSNTIFLSSAWISAWCETLGASCELILPKVYKKGVLVGAAAFWLDANVLRFAADDRADYADVLLHESLNSTEKVLVVESLLAQTRAKCPGHKHFILRRVRSSSAFFSAISKTQDWHLTISHSTVAPALDMADVEDKLKKKSLKRHDNALRKRGDVTFETYDNIDAMHDKLEGFFGQHIERWSNTGSPSLFLNESNKEFYRALATRLAKSGCLRFSELRLDGALAASHFGFFYAGVYTWYKPTFDPSMAKQSPGEVMIKRLLETARDSDAKSFDFTIGNEKFKSRFATEVETVHNLHVTSSLWNSYGKRLRLRVLSFYLEMIAKFRSTEKQF